MTPESAPHPDFAREQAHLAQVIAGIERSLSLLPQRSGGGNAWTDTVLDARRAGLIHELELARQEPYFGRIDFQADDEGAPGAYYIGKHEAPGVTDWRAPVAHLFYEATGGRAAYRAPEGSIAGNLSLRRHFEVVDDRLRSVVDSISEAAALGSLTGTVLDEVLRRELAKHASQSLRDIIATIQVEQNRVIRAPLERIIVVQGVAGSGKTSVALHRAAYLMYAYPEQVRPERMLLVAPNRLFLAFIEKLLPDLGVPNVKQVTFTDWAAQLTGVKPAPGPEPPERRQAKTAARTQAELDRWLPGYVRRLLPAADCRLDSGEVVPAATLRMWYEGDYVSWPVMMRFSRILQRLERMANTRGRKPGKPPGDAGLQTYRRLLPGPDAHVQAWRSFLDETGLALAEQRLSAADLPGLVYLYDRLFDIKAADRYDHILVDEAQDLAPLHFAALVGRCANPSLTVVGDLSQVLQSTADAPDWAATLGPAIPPESIEHYTFLQSYRSTREIILLARAVLERGAPWLPRPEPVLRTGPPPVLLGFADHKALVAHTADLARDLLSRHQTLALITADGEQAQALHKALRAAGLSGLGLVASPEAARTDPAVVIPVLAAKGLEFDAVVVVGVDAVAFPAAALPARRLYVALTRALHELHVLWAGAASPLLPPAAAAP